MTKKTIFLDVAFWSLVTICVLNLNGVATLGFGFSQTTTPLIALLCFAVLYLLNFSPERHIGKPEFWFIIFILVYLGIGTSSKFDFRTFTAHCGTLLLVISVSVGTQEQILRHGILKTFTRMAVISAVSGLLILTSPFLTPLYSKMSKVIAGFESGRWIGFFANPNSAGVAATLGSTLLISVIPLKRSINLRWKLVIIILVLFLALATFLTFSRTAGFIFLAAFSTLLLLNFRPSGRWLAAMVIFSLSLSFIFWFFTGGYRNFDLSREQLRRVKSVSVIVEKRDLGSRANSSNAGLDYMKKAPIFGHGLGTFHRMPRKYYGGLGCHNTHLMVIGEGGIVTAFFYFLFILNLFLSIARIKPPLKWILLITCLIFFLFAATSHDFFTDRNLNVFLGFVMGVTTVGNLHPKFADNH